MHSAVRPRYIYVIEGKISVAEEVLHKRDGMGVEGVDQLVCQGIETSDVLLIEVPMWFGVKPSKAQAA